MDKNNRIEKYINTFEQIDEGQRNGTLYKLGLSLRAEFGLTGDDLVSWLLYANQMKCNPPLSDGEVTGIARSVDKSDIPIGEATTVHNGQHSEKRTKTEHSGERLTWYCTCTNSVTVDTLLQKRVSIYTNCRTNTPSVPPNETPTIGNVLEMFHVSTRFKEQIEAVRKESDKEKRGALKRRLPAVVFSSEPQEKRNNASCKPNGILCLDFDGIPTDKLESAKKTIAAVHYVIAVGLSVSGTGLFALVAYEGMPDLKMLLVAMQADFPDYEIDKQCSDVARMRFVTLDENLHINGVVSSAVLTERTEPAIDLQTESKSKESATGKQDKESHAGNTEPMPYVPFPIDRLPHVVRKMILAVKDVVGLSDSSTAAVVAITVLSSLLGFVKIQRKRGYTQPAHLFSCIVDRSGGAKTPVLKHFVDYLQYKQEGNILQWECNIVDFEQNKKESKDAKEPPPPERHIVSDITIESLGQKLKENPNGLLLYRGELDGFFGDMGKYSKGRDVPHYIDFHDGISTTIDRVGNKGVIHIPRPAVAITGGIQIGILATRLSDNPDFLTSGLIARFLLALPPTEAIKDNDNEIPETVSEQWKALIDNLLSYRKYTIAPHVFCLTDEAKAIYRIYQHRHADLAVLTSGKESALEGKFATHSLRIALILHVVEQVTSEQKLDLCPLVTAETMASACEIAEWFIDEGLRIYSILLDGKTIVTELTPQQQVVMKVLIRVGKPLTKDEIKKHSRPCQDLDKEKLLDDILSELVKAKRIADNFREQDGAGRPAIEYKIFCE